VIVPRSGWRVPERLVVDRHSHAFEHLRTDLRLLREIVLNAGSTAVEESRALNLCLVLRRGPRGKDVDEKSGDLFGAISGF